MGFRHWALIVLGLVLADAAVAQTPTRVRGKIEQVDGMTLSVKARDGTALKVVLADNAVILGVVKKSLADIKAGEFIGTAATSQGDGTWKALEVHIFPENMRGTGEGHRAWEMPRSSMTNATVVDKVSKMDGHTMTLRYKGGEQQVVVTDETPIVGYVPGDRSDLKIRRRDLHSGGDPRR
jgi:outer membrane lipoprotein SlyB